MLINNAIKNSKMSKDLNKTDKISKQIISEIENRAAKLNISIAELCSRASVAPSTFSRWRKNKASPLVKTIERMNLILDDLEKAKLINEEADEKKPLKN